MGRGGDTLMAHLTPGEVEVPPEVQTPKVLATLKKAFEDKGVSAQQFTAGSPQSSLNPQTGLPEYNFMSAFLPAALGIAGAVAAPMTGGTSLGLSDLALASLGGGLGTTAGGLLAGEKPTQAVLSGVGSAAGGYALGGGLGAATGAAGSAGGNAALTPAQQAIMSAKDPAAAMAAAQQMGISMGGQNAAVSALDQSLGQQSSAPALNNLWGNLPNGSINPMRSIGSTVGGYIGGQLGAPPKPNAPNYPPGFNTPMTPFANLGSPRQMLGQNSNSAVNANFNGYNPATNYPAAYNFFPKM